MSKKEVCWFPFTEHKWQLVAVVFVVFNRMLMICLDIAANFQIVFIFHESSITHTEDNYSLVVEPKTPKLYDFL